MLLDSSGYSGQLARNSGIDPAHNTLQFGELPDHLADKIRFAQFSRPGNLGFELLSLLFTVQTDIHRLGDEFADFGNALNFLIHGAQLGLK